MRILFLSLFLIATSSQGFAQYKFHLPNKHDYTSAYLYRSDRSNGFVLNMSVVAMFTTGAVDRNGFRLGGGLSVGYQLGDWLISSGVDSYKAKEKYKLGTSYVGVKYEDRYGYGGSYYVNHYYQGDKQTSAIIALLLDDFQVRFEDDILALPFTEFKIYDRFRTAALEVQFKNILIGTNVYTTDINGMTDISKSNSKGVYRNGKQISSPIYAGYTARGLIGRLGWNGKAGGVVGQNSWHRGLFGTPDFKQGGYENAFIQLGVNKSYTLY